jgi:hypothetical protein
LNQDAEDLEASFMRERGERRDYDRLLHIFRDIELLTSGGQGQSAGCTRPHPGSVEPTARLGRMTC